MPEPKILAMAVLVECETCHGHRCFKCLWQGSYRREVSLEELRRQILEPAAPEVA